MILKKPKFWEIEGLGAHLFLPFSVVYFLYLRLKSKFIKPKKLAAKIICIGNATVGGAGKTPTAIKVAKIIKSITPETKIAFVSKGYLGSQLEPVLVDTAQHSPKIVGDEPLLLAKVSPCFVGKNRIKTCEYAIAQGFKILILDDGLQDLRLHKDLSFLVIDGGYGFGNFMPLPAGPLRDRLDFAAPNISAAIIIGKDEKQAEIYLNKKLSSPEVIFAEFVSQQAPSKNNADNYFAFAGIGRPEKFYNSLKKSGYKLLREVNFPDHYFYTKNDEKNLLDAAKKLNAKLITTEKDYIKLSDELRNNVEVFTVDLNLNDAAIARHIKNIL